jgi:hypothetical protein
MANLTIEETKNKPIKTKKMKNVKLFLSTVVVFLMIGTTSVVNAQQKQSVIISEVFSPNGVSIEIIKPNYSIEQQDYKRKEVNATVLLKKELDKWIVQGFEIKESNQKSTISNGMTHDSKISYILIKEG